MIATIILCVIVRGLAFYQVFKQNLFSAVIMAMLSLAAAMAAFDFYEILSEQLIKAGLKGYPPETGTFLGLFIITLLLLRLASDKLIKGNMKFTMLVDRIGSAVMGLMAGLIMAGMVALGFQLLPIPSKFLGYDRFPDIERLSQPGAVANTSDFENRLGSEKGLFPFADGLVFSLVKHASNYGFAGSTPLSRFHPDLPRELYLNRLLLNQESASRIEAYQALTVSRAWVVKEPVSDAQTNQEVFLQPNETLLAVRILINPGSGDKNPGARDADSKIRYVISNFRLIGYSQDQPDQTNLIRYPLGFFQPAEALVEIAGLGDMKIEAGSPEVVVLFTWPSDLKSIPPQFIEFKRTSRAPMPPPG